MGLSDILEGEMTTKQMGLIMIFYMLALTVFGILAVMLIHGYGWRLI
ncbi:hypothetical protein SAMN06264855_103157 [Halorubrum vacuolatum]|uniref:Uncharacterized protein n=1 Tax=Halorubrum vacuolatum TaxID=63740 RepID=A0A238VN61_HALVU|nr:hypothetical protein SAMN06264855_103157 [Halorubrum vacuolatum]